jgi:hypothetical protein
MLYLVKNNMDTNINNSEKAEIKQKPNRIRDSKGRMIFPPGVSGNPKGKPKGLRSFTTKVREALEKIADGKDYTNEEAFIKSILKKAINDGDSSTQKLIWNYLDGMPSQSIDHTSMLFHNFHLGKPKFQYDLCYLLLLLLSVGQSLLLA